MILIISVMMMINVTFFFKTLTTMTERLVVPADLVERLVDLAESLRNTTISAGAENSTISYEFLDIVSKYTGSSVSGDPDPASVRNVLSLITQDVIDLFTNPTRRQKLVPANWLDIGGHIPDDEFMPTVFGPQNGYRVGNSRLTDYNRLI